MNIVTKRAADTTGVKTTFMQGQRDLLFRKYSNMAVEKDKPDDSSPQARVRVVEDVRRKVTIDTED